MVGQSWNQKKTQTMSVYWYVLKKFGVTDSVTHWLDSSPISIHYIPLSPLFWNVYIYIITNIPSICHEYPHSIPFASPTLPWSTIIFGPMDHLEAVTATLPGRLPLARRLPRPQLVGEWPPAPGGASQELWKRGSTGPGLSMELSGLKPSLVIKWNITIRLSMDTH